MNSISLTSQPTKKLSWDQIFLKKLLKSRISLNAWERQFAQSNVNRNDFSKKQKLTINRLRSKYAV